MPKAPSPYAPASISSGGYHGRVRSGCLTCRSRKVKCHEARPVCNHCTRLKRHCVYKQPKAPQPAEQDHGIGTPPSLEAASSCSPSELPGAVHVVLPSSLFDGADAAAAAAGSSEGGAPRFLIESTNQFQYPSISTVEVMTRLRKALQTRRENLFETQDAQPEADSPSRLISRDIELTTTMDLLVARGKPLRHPSSIFCLDKVECPTITPFDPVNWDIAKHRIVELAKSCEAVSEAIMAICGVYKGQMYAMCTSLSLSPYRCAKSAFQELLEDRSHEFFTVLVAAFLLCLFELIYPGELSPVFNEPSKVLLERLGDWAERASTHSELVIRLVAWLRIIHRITLRGGGTGLISDEVYGLLPSYDGPLPDIKPGPGYHMDVASHLYQALSGPIFDFYYRLQLLSGEIAQLTHYHRSRITADDQDEVVGLISSIDSRLRALWASRCATHCQTPGDLDSQLGPSVAGRIVSLIGICDAAYHAEVIEIDRVLGDPVSKSSESRRSMQAIRDIVDASWERGRRGDVASATTTTSTVGKLNPGFLRPLFMCAIECMDRMSQIQNPIYRSDFFAAFGKALSDAQLRMERRVTSKYFCHWYFGTSPPFM